MPEAALERIVNYNLDQMLRYNMDRGISEEDLSKHREELTERARKGAEAQLKEQMILERIRKDEKVELTPQEINEAFMRYAIRERMDKNAVTEMTRNREMMNNFVRATLREKILAMVLEKTGQKA